MIRLNPREMAILEDRSLVKEFIFARDPRSVQQIYPPDSCGIRGL